jgi:hypothetical protein
MTRSCPGAVAAIALLRVDDGRGVIASAEVPPWLVSVCISAPKCRRLALLGDRLAKPLYLKYAAMQRDNVPVAVVGREIPTLAANWLNFFVRFLAAIPYI